MSRYRIAESVGRRVEAVHSYEDLEIHHPSRNALGLRTGRAQDFEHKRAHQRVAGEFEEVRLQPDGRALVKKDFILSRDGHGPVNVPAPVEGYVHYLHDKYASVRIYDRPFGQSGAKLLAQSLHMDPRTFRLKEGERIAYGQPMGAMSDTGTPGAVHAHVEVGLQQFRKYIRDIDAGVITPERYPGREAAGPPGATSAAEIRGQERDHSAHAPATVAGKNSLDTTRIRALQTALNHLGYHDARGHRLAVDGDYGRHTREAVERFQRDHGLKVDGVVGLKTLQALHRAEHPLLSDARHPQHAFFMQAREKVQLMEGQRCIGTGPHTDRLAGVVAVDALKHGLTRIDRVELSEDGHRVRAVQVSSVGDIPGLNRTSAPVATQHAVQQPLGVSSEQIRHVAVEQPHARQPAPEHPQAVSHHVVQPSAPVMAR